MARNAVEADRMAKARAVMQMFDQERRYGPYESNSSVDDDGKPVLYWVIHHSDGHLSCGCRGWINRGGGKPNHPSRTCGHQEKEMVKLAAMGCKFEIRKIGEPKLDKKSGLMTQDAQTFVIERKSNAGL